MASITYDFEPRKREEISTRIKYHDRLANIYSSLALESKLRLVARVYTLLEELHKIFVHYWKKSRINASRATITADSIEYAVTENERSKSLRPVMEYLAMLREEHDMIQEAVLKLFNEAMSVPENKMRKDCAIHAPTLE